VIGRDSVGMLERVTFTVNANQAKHQLLLTELKASDAADQVVAFRDVEAE